MPSTVAMLAASLVLLSGCGGADPAAPVGTPAPADATLIATLGDSITAGSPLWDPEPSRRGPDADERSQFQHWARAEGRAFRNCGVWGERTDEIAARFDTCVRDADVLLVQGGINDVVQGRPVADAAEDLRAMVRRGREAGLPVLLTNVLPWNNGHPAAAKPIRDLNARIARIAAEEEAVLVDFFGALEDPAARDRMRAEWTSDGDHPNINGHQVLGRLLAERLAVSARG